MRKLTLKSALRRLAGKRKAVAAPKAAPAETTRPNPPVEKPKTQAFEAVPEFKWVKLDNKFSTLIDIGANDGSFGAFLQTYMGIAAVHAFEPLPGRQETLRNRGFTVHQMALGNENSAVTFTVNSEDASSSILPMSTIMREKFPQLSEARQIDVPLRRLDDALPVSDLASDILIKVDAQGYEDKIIEGGRKTFSAASAVIIEMSFVPMYDGQPLFDKVHAQLVELGFRLTGIKDQTSTVSERRPLFCHCVYQK